MAFSRTSYLLLLFLLLGGACAKPPSKGALSSAAGNCEPGVVADALAQITRAESERTRLDEIAKASPAKTNFQKLYAAEVELREKGKTQLTKLTECGVAASTLEDLQKKISKADAGAQYLVESFPELK